MKRLKNIEYAGFPVTGATMMQIDEIIGQVADFATAINGDNYVSSGVVNNGTDVYSDGYIVWAGEILPFQGGEKQDTVTIIEENVTATYQDNQQKGYYTNRYARFGNDGVTTFNFADLKPVYANFAEKVFGENGVILPWHKTVAEIPQGFSPCDGTNNTPNLGGRFLAGLDADDIDYNVVGKTGGLKEVQLTVGQMPSHGHGLNDPGHGHGIIQDDQTPYLNGRYTTNEHNYDASSTSGSGDARENNTTKESTGITLSNTGGNGSHENRPPYYVVNYIMWIGF